MNHVEHTAPLVKLNLSQIYVIIVMHTYITIPYAAAGAGINIAKEKSHLKIVLHLLIA